MVKIESLRGKFYTILNVNQPETVINYSTGDETHVSNGVPSYLHLEQMGDHLLISMPMTIDSHILGLGERAFRIDRKRLKLSSLNSDPGGYERGRDPIYFPIPFMIKKDSSTAVGIFINYPGEIKIDTGVDNYDKISMEIFSDSVQVFIIDGKSVKEIADNFIRLTGRPFLPPKWAAGHTISRYSYYPESEALNIAKRYREITKVDAMYMDIHHMDGYRLFKWDSKRFGDGSQFLKKMHELGIRVITIVDPSIKADQNYDVFLRGMGSYVSKSNDDIYVANMWPGNSVFPDFLNEKGREFWKQEIQKWVKQGIDGIWLDMNEPTILTEDHMFDLDAEHLLDSGKKYKHREVRNAYPYFEAKATYDALLESHMEPFILTRSGFAGIQKYAAVWTGDTKSSWDDLLLQISMVTSLSLSGVTVVGCDLGGFFGESSPSLISAYYRMALFFPLYRNHKTIDGNDQEIFLLPAKDRDGILRSIDIRYKFLDQIYNALYFSSREMRLAVAPMAYLYDMNESYYSDDQYMLGDNLLYAPQIYENRQERELFLPEGAWFNFWSKEKISGPGYVRTNDEYPVYVRNNSAIIYDGEVYLFGNGQFNLYLDGDERTIKVHDSRILENTLPDKYKIKIFN